jgi:hypothetical protein
MGTGETRIYKTQILNNDRARDPYSIIGGCTDAPALDGFGGTSFTGLSFEKIERGTRGV